MYSVIIQRSTASMATYIAVSGDQPKRIAALFPAVLTILTLVACGSSGSPNNPTSGAKNRAFISNTFSGNLQIVDTQNDTTPLTAQTVNSAGQVVPGQPVTIPVSTDVTFEVESPDSTTTMVYDPTTISIFFVTNSTELAAGSIAITSQAGMAIFSPDSATVYVPEPNLNITGGELGGVEGLNRVSATIAARYPVPSARYVAISPSGNTLFVFADNSDSVFLINVKLTYCADGDRGPRFRAAGECLLLAGDSNTVSYVIKLRPRVRFRAIPRRLTSCFRHSFADHQGDGPGWRREFVWLPQRHDAVPFAGSSGSSRNCLDLTKTPLMSAT